MIEKQEDNKADSKEEPVKKITTPYEEFQKELLAIRDRILRWFIAVSGCCGVKLWTSPVVNIIVWIIGRIAAISYNHSVELHSGIITERHIVRILGSLELDLLKIPVRQLMSKPLIIISPNSSIKDAMQTMQSKNIRRLVVVEKEEKSSR